MGPVRYCLCNKPVLGLFMFLLSLCKFPPPLPPQDVSFEKSGRILECSFEAPVEKKYALNILFFFKNYEEKIKDKVVGRFDFGGTGIPLKVVIKKLPDLNIVLNKLILTSGTNNYPGGNQKIRRICEFFLKRGRYVIEIYNILELEEFKNIKVKNYFNWRSWENMKAFFYSLYLFLLFFTNYSVFCGENPIFFKDRNLESIIREKIIVQNGGIYAEDVQFITKLNIKNCEIESLSGLEFLSNLRELDVSSNNINCIEPLAKLTKLTSLNLCNNEIVNITPLTKLFKLKWIAIEHNRIEDISSLYGLTNLAFVDLSHNNISDISPLSTQNNLETLDLRSNKIRDISPITNLTKLTMLDLSSNKIPNLSSISKLHNLKMIYISFNEISNVSQLSELSKLVFIDLRNNKIMDINPLSKLNKLKILHLNNNKLTNISPLNNLTNTYIFWK